MKKILIISTWLPGGGVETVINNFYSNLNDKFDLEVIVLSNKQNWDWPNPELKIERQEIFQSDKISIREVVKKWRLLRNLLDNKLAKSKPDIIIFTHSILGCFLAKYKKSIKVIFWPHNTFFNQNSSIHNFIKKLYLKIVIGQPHISLAITTSLKNELKRLNFNSYLTFNPVLNAEKVNLNIPSKNNFLFIGKLDKRKNLIHVLKELKQVPKPWTIDIIGDGPELKKFKKDFKSTQGGIINWKGYQKQLFNENLSYTCLINSSLSEGFPMVIADALLHGIPVVAPEHLLLGNDIIYSNANGSEYDLFKSGELAKILSDNREYLSPSCISNMHKAKFGKQAYNKRFIDSIYKLFEC